VNEVKICTFTNPVGIPMAAKLVPVGRRYGKDMCCINDEGVAFQNGPQPMVEFYDLRWDHTALGQFISRYYVSTLRERPIGGLCLDGGVPDWHISERNFSFVMFELDLCYPRANGG
jgi:hypothetical protein